MGGMEFRRVVFGSLAGRPFPWGGGGVEKRPDALDRVGLLAGPTEEVALPGQDLLLVDLLNGLTANDLRDRSRNRGHVRRDVLRDLEPRRQHLGRRPYARDQAAPISLATEEDTPRQKT